MGKIMTQYNYSRAHLTRMAVLFVMFIAVDAQAEYTETMDPKGLTRNVKDYGLVDDQGRTDQSSTMQKAVDEVAEQDGGRLILPKGTYSFTEVALKSNVHLLIEKGTVLKPVKSKSTGDGKWLFAVGRDGPVENVSIRGLGGRFSASLEEFTNTCRIRVIALGDVNNFLISDMDVHDCFTVFSSIILTSPDSEKTGFVGPMNGTIKDCSTFNADNGYGLVQSHAAKSVLYDNLYALGGVAMRLECGVRPKNPEQKGGLFDITGRNIKCKDGYTALLLSPHSTHCGVATVDGVEATGCEFAVKITGGFISKRKKREGDEPGSFATGTTARNVRAVFGKNAQLSAKHLPYLPKEMRAHVVPHEDLKMLRGPSITAVLDHSNYDVEIENVETEGYKGIKPIMTREDALKDAEIKAMTNKYRRRNWRNN